MREIKSYKLIYLRAVVVSQLVKRLLPTPEIRGSNPVIGNFHTYVSTVNCIEKTKINEKEASNGPKRKTFIYLH